MLEKARVQDEEGLREILRKLVSSQDSVSFALSQPTDRVLHFVKSLKSVRVYIRTEFAVSS